MDTQPKPARTCAPKWYDVPDEKWFDWRWQLANRLNSVEELGEVIRLTDSEKQALSAKGLFRVDITPYFASLIDPDDPNCPVRKQVIPTARELEKFESQMEDSLAEDRHSPVPGLVHRYPDRVLFLVTTQCASYCRYCTRSRIVGDAGATFKRTEWDAAIDYLKRTPQVRDVLLSGGDPLTLAPKLLEELLARLREIPHIEIIRIGSRVPVFMPHAHRSGILRHGAEVSSVLDEHPCQPCARDYARTAPGLRSADARGRAAGQSKRAAGRRQRLGQHPARVGARAGEDARAPVLSVSMRSGGRLWPSAHHGVARASRSSKGCAATPAALPCRRSASMGRAAAARFR